MADWIDAAKQIPPEEWVLICVRHSYGPPDVNIGTWDRYRERWGSRIGWKIAGTVTHWMPLPEPPEALGAEVE